MTSKAGSAPQPSVDGASSETVIDMWAPILPTTEVMEYVAEHFPGQMAGYLRVFFKQEPRPDQLQEHRREAFGHSTRTR